MRFTDPLPIDDVLDPLLQTLEAGTRAVLVAPPGAGKTTRVPLALLDAPWAAGKCGSGFGAGFGGAAKFQFRFADFGHVCHAGRRAGGRAFAKFKNY